MFNKIFLILILILSFSIYSCGKKDLEYEPQNKADPYKLYEEAFISFEE